MEQTASIEQTASLEQAASLERTSAPPRRGGRLRRLLLAAAVSISVAGATVVVTAEPAHAEPGYFLYEYPANIIGPCGSQLSIGSYIGYAYFNPPWVWDTVHVSTYWSGDRQIWEYKERGFQYGNHYNACHNYKFVIRVYGAATTHRIIKHTFWCRQTSCTYLGVTYGAWKSGW